MNAVSLDDLLLIIGNKEAQLFQLSRENATLRRELKSLQSAPPPGNVLPFTQEVHTSDEQHD